jgi:hypothetical protein
MRKKPDEQHPVFYWLPRSSNYAAGIIENVQKNNLLTGRFFHILHFLFYHRLVFFLLFRR